MRRITLNRTDYYVFVRLTVLLTGYAVYVEQGHFQYK